MVQAGNGGEEFQVLGDAISFGSVRIHPQDSKLFEYTVNGKNVARGALSTQELNGIPHEVLTIYNARGTLIGTVTGPQTSKWFHTAKTYDVVDAFGRQIFSIDHSLVLFNRMVWFDEQTRIIGGASRSRIAGRAPFQFTFAYQPDDIHPAFFVLPLIAFRADNFASGKGIFNTLKDDFSKIMDWASGKR